MKLNDTQIELLGVFIKMTNLILIEIFGSISIHCLLCRISSVTSTVRLTDNQSCWHFNQYGFNIIFDTFLWYMANIAVTFIKHIYQYPLTNTTFSSINLINCVAKCRKKGIVYKIDTNDWKKVKLIDWHIWHSMPIEIALCPIAKKFSRICWNSTKFPC